VQRIGRYELIEELGAGGMGTVHLACERSTGNADRLIALKLIRTSDAGGPSADDLVRFLVNEASIVARLAHDNVVRIHRLGEQDGHYFIAMELVDGATLRELIGSVATMGPLPIGACAAAVMQACRGAHAAHELTDEDGKKLELVHRDISPHNVIVDEAGTAKLLDFGIATDAAHSATGAKVWGKSSYVSPEQAHGAALDRRSDVYALGGVLWELLAGKRRIDRGDDHANIVAIVNGAGPGLASERADVPRALVGVVERALSLRPADRFATAAHLADAIEEAVRHAGFDTRREALASVVRERTGAIVARRRQRVLGIEQTLRASVAAGRGDVDEPTVVEERVAGARVEAAVRVVPLDDDERQSPLPVVASGANFELRSDARVLICRVWARPDLSREEGAQSGQRLMKLMLDAFTQPSLRAVLMDARQAKMVIGGRTLEAIERMFVGAEQHGITIVALISNDPLQKLDFADVVGRAAPRHGRVSVELDEALRLVGLPPR
jgi:hypothetical protein